ncbi:hypothetical protein T439DRAFT_325512, partial [Meredithblackwellia eburnea MCA 4105]
MPRTAGRWAGRSRCTGQQLAWLILKHEIASIIQKGIFHTLHHYIQQQLLLTVLMLVDH